MNSAPACYAIPAGKAFVNTLADWLLAQYGQQAGTLSKTLVLLPTRRACRSLRDAFLERSGGEPLLLPRIQPLGEGDETYAAAHYGGQQPIIPSAITPLHRQLMLTQLVHAFQNHKYGQDQQAFQQAGRGYNLEQAAKLARQLARFLDEVAREELSLDRLPELVDDNDLSEHWQQIVAFLGIISHQWPQILKKEGLLDVAQYQNTLLHAMVDLWKARPPSTPVIAAGSTGSQPAATALLTVISKLPQGKVVLPALDLGMADQEWGMLPETHPQYALKSLLVALGCERKDVALLGSDPDPACFERDICLRSAFQPPAATMHWSKLALPLQKGLSHVHLLTADTQLDEARMIAIALRETLESPAKTAALITPDRALARMVAAQMQRFGIVMDDSAGRPLKETAPAAFLHFTADMVASAAAPAPLLTLLRHPLAAAGLEPATCRLLSRNLETALLRGIRFTPGLDALCDKARDDKTKDSQDIYRLLDAIRMQGRAFTALMTSGKPVPLRELLSAHIAFAQWLASTPDKAGEERLWAGEAGNALAAFLGQLMEYADQLEPLDPAIYPGLMDSLLADQVYRPRHGLHPRLHILGPMEARLQHFDRVILGGLNEGAWPKSPEADPWMSRPMRASFGLPAPEYAVGLAAHDIYQFCMAPEVFLSRARKAEGIPTVPSRWLVRLQTLVEGMDASYWQSMQAGDRYRQALALLDKPDAVPAMEPPAPVPPLDARPRTIRVTAVDQWLREPYWLYAHYILALKKLKPLDEEPDAALFGTLVHASLEQFARRWPQSLPSDPLDALLECGRRVFADYASRPAVACLWWPRFEHIAGWIIACEQERRANGSRILAETKGIWELSIDGQPFTLTTSIDRIELHTDGSAAIVDYKTGSPPGKKDFKEGTANQLPLEALIALHGELTPPLQPRPVSIASAEYWKLAGSAEKCEINCFSDLAADGIASWLEQTHISLEALVRRFDQPGQPYAAQANPAQRPSYNDYDHLIRYKEWEAV